MRVAVLEEIIDKYSKALDTRYQYEHLHWYESVQHFQQNWNLTATDFPEMYKSSLHNKVNKRLWQRQHYDAKLMMHKLLKFDPEHGRQAFLDLFNEQADIHIRLSRFDLHCESLMAGFREQNPLSTDTFHGQDAQMISVYLAFRTPELYAIYHGDAYVKILKEAESRNIPAHDDLSRFFVFCKTMFTLMQRHPRVLQQHKNRLKRRGLFTVSDKLIITDLMLWFSGNRF